VSQCQLCSRCPAHAHIAVRMRTLPICHSGLLKIRSWEFAIKLFGDEYKVPLLDPVWAARLDIEGFERAFSGAGCLVGAVLGLFDQFHDLGRSFQNRLHASGKVDN
jgi:hypothetical protein